MSKSKLGRNPFGQTTTESPASEQPKRTAETPASSKKRRANTANRKQSRTERTKERKKPQTLQDLLHELTRHWIPRLSACAYARVIKLVSKFA